MKARNQESLRPLVNEPRLLEFKFHLRLLEILGKKNSQVVNLLAGGNVPESPKDVAKAILPKAEEPERSVLAQRLTTLDDVTPEMVLAIETYNNAETTDKKIRFVDTPNRIEAQFRAFKANIASLVDEQVKAGV